MKIIPERPAKTYDKAILMGRWQIPHLGHITLFRKALELAPEIIVVIGSALRARDSRNPFNADERKEMILRSLDEKDHSRVSFIYMRDYYSTPRWARKVREAAQQFIKQGDKVTLVGFRKDSTSLYLNDFPEWRLEEVSPEHAIDATSLRDIYFGADADTADALLSSYVTPKVLAYLKAWRNLPDFKIRVADSAKIKAYKKDYAAPWYMTADVLVEIGDYVLMIVRGGEFGNDLYAWPGGFVNPNELLFDAALRESDEETKLGFSRAAMEHALQGSALLDHPLRSPRGRLVSMIYHFKFEAREHLPEVFGRDDAKKACWVHKSKLAELEARMFEDHFMAGDHFLKILPD